MEGNDFSGRCIECLGFGASISFEQLLYIYYIVYIYCMYIRNVIVYIWNEAGSERCLRDFRSRLYIDI